MIDASKRLILGTLCLGSALFISACGGSDQAPVTVGVAQAASAPTTIDPYALPITVEGGQIQGTTSTDGTIAEYKGIPFAAPPVGSLRWKPAQAVVPWTGVKQTVAFSPDCIGGATGASEDCLYANVWTKKDNLVGKPVIIFAYGSGNSGGGASGMGSNNNGESIAAKGVVWVNFNYRASILGWLAHPALTAEDPNWPSSGNYGLSDYLAVAKWVKNNIAKFGGDPNNVTFTAQSAGASNLQLLIGSPLAAGLFKRAFSMSSNTYNKVVLTRAKQEALGAATFPGMTLAQMRAMTAAQVQALTFPQPIVFSVDGMILKSGNTTQWNQGAVAFYKAGTANDMPLVTGHAYEDSARSEDIIESDAHVGSYNQVGNPANVSQAQFVANATAAFGPTLMPRLLALYTAPTGTLNYLSLIKQINIEGMMAKQNYQLAKSKALHSVQPTWTFLVTRGTPGPNEQTSGILATHASDIPRWFGYMSPTNLYWTSVDVSEYNILSSYMVNYAKTGNPNGTDRAGVALPRWDPYTAGLPITYLNDNGTVSTTTLSAAKSAFWQDYIDQVLADTVARYSGDGL